MDRPLAGRTVLVVEDEMLILMMLENMLAALGCTSVHSAGTNEMALALIAEQVFDAVMLDMNLRGMSSQPVAEALAALGTPFIYSTGSSLEEIDAGYRDRPMLRKPFASESLAVALNAVLNSEASRGSPP